MKSTKTYAAYALVAGLAMLAASCGSTTEVDSSDTSAATSESSDEASANDATNETSDASRDERIAQSAAGDFPEITGVNLEADAEGTWTVEVTVSSPYDTPERYADAWRILDPDGNELGVRELAHDHQNEQPFTRSLEGVEIPETVSKITVEGRDLTNGWGGQTFTLSMPAPSTY